MFPRLLSLLAVVPLSALLLTASIEPAEAQLYRWVDDDGNVHYTDSIPPERARDGRRVYSRDGVAEEDIEAAPTEEERQALREQRRREQEEAEAERRAREEQAAFDRFLLRTYTGTDHIHRVREDRMDSVDRRRRQVQSRLERDQAELEGLREQAAEAERRSGREAELDRLYQRIERIEERLESRWDSLEDLDREEARMEEEFRSHLERYRELQAR